MAKAFALHGIVSTRLSKKTTGGGPLKPLAKQREDGSSRFAMCLRSRVSATRRQDTVAAEEREKLPPLRSFEITRQDDLEMLHEFMNEWNLRKKKKGRNARKKRRQAAG